MGAKNFTIVMHHTTTEEILSLHSGYWESDAKACARVDRVYVDDVYLPECVAYDMDAGWAFNKVNGVWQPKVYGVVRVVLKEGA